MVVGSGEVSSLSQEGVMAHWENGRDSIPLEFRVPGED